MRTTLADAKASRIPAAIGVCSTDDKFLQLLNEAQQRLLTKGKWWGTTARFRICATNGCITLPAQIATIEAVAICGTPINVRDWWYEFLENGYGVVGAGSTNSDGTGCCNTSSGAGGCGCGMSNAIYRGRYPSFDDIRGLDKQLNLVCDLASDVGKTVLALGYDENGNWIRTNQGGIILDGEVITLAQGAGTLSTNLFSVITDLQLPDDLDGQVWLYEYDTTALTQRLIGTYQYFETRPSYARYYFPTILTTTESDGTCNKTVVDIIGKLEFIPAKKDTDYLLISNIPALKAMMVAINNAEKEPDNLRKKEIIKAGYDEAVSELDFELDSYLGSGRKIGVNIIGSSLGAVDPVPSFL